MPALTPSQLRALQSAARNASTIPGQSEQSEHDETVRRQDLVGIPFRIMRCDYDVQTEHGPATVVHIERADTGKAVAFFSGRFIGSQLDPDNAHAITEADWRRHYYTCVELPDLAGGKYTRYGKKGEIVQSPILLAVVDVTFSPDNQDDQDEQDDIQDEQDEQDEQDDELPARYPARATRKAPTPPARPSQAAAAKGITKALQSRQSRPSAVTAPATTPVAAPKAGNKPPFTWQHLRGIKAVEQTPSGIWMLQGGPHRPGRGRRPSGAVAFSTVTGHYMRTADDGRLVLC